jgi:hypothetical protein
MFIITSMLIVPVYAKPGNGPKYEKYVSSLGIEETRYGQVIFNTNPEDDGTYELEVEIEEAMDLVSSTVSVYMDGELVGEIEVNEYGNGKATFYVENPTDSVVTVEGAVSLTSGDWRLWVKGPGPK